MQVRVFEAPDMATGLRMVKKELGPDALILSTRTVRSGKLGLLGKPILEITAAIDADYQQDKAFPHHHQPRWNQAVEQPHIPPATRPPQKADTVQRGNFHSVLDEPVEQYLQQEQVRQQAAPNPRAGLESKEAPSKNQELQGEVDELKDLVKNLAGQIAQLNVQSQQPQTQKRTELKVQDSQYPKNSLGVIHGDHLLSKLVDHGINVESSRTIATFLRESLTEQELGNESLLNRAIISCITNLIEVDTPEFTSGKEQKRIALIGPTGVGKTTTLAKIAANHLVHHSGKIALITIDTYRIAAVEQLKVYGEIMHLPVEIVIRPDQLLEALARHEDKDLILIDTAGRSPKDQFCIDELSSFFPDELKIDKHLVLSAATREKELGHTIERFSELGLTHTIFTKIDECENLGVLLNVQIQNSCPLSYLTNGQRVPEDLLTITPQFVAELIMDQHTGTTNDEPSNDN